MKTYFSHYDKKSRERKRLETHLVEVAGAAQNNVPTFLHFDVINNKQVQKILELHGLFHDLGKYTDYFQDYLVHDQRSNYQNHSHISAMILYCFMKEGFVDIDVDDKTNDILFFLCYVIIRRHHNSLSVDMLFNLENVPRMRAELNMQIKNLLEKQEVLAKMYTLNEQEIRHLLLKVGEVFEDKKFRRSAKRIAMNHAHERWYFFMIYCFSQLVDKDKLSAADLTQRSRVLLKPQFVSDYIRLKSQGQRSNMNHKREQARQMVLSKINNMSDEEIRNRRIFTLTAPTGLGKTLTSMQAAFRLSERLGKMYSYTPKIITAIPFINIIEQTKEDYAAVLESRGVLNVHHRLADKRLLNSGKASEGIPIEKSMLEVEAWEGDVILTTFVQFFQSLFTGQNARLKKVNKLAGSIVILDEVQSIPEKYMPLVGATLIKISEYFGTRFILMSATQPYLLEMGQRLLEQCAITNLNTDTFDSSTSQSVVLLPDYAEYYKLQTRTKLIPFLQQEFDTDSFIDFFGRTWAERSAVIVVNTINRCIDVYKCMKDEFKNKAIVYHLSTNLIPKERKRVIEEVKEVLKSGETVILVSTQTIEAGVDLDFEVGYRDLAPLESIVQTAGRVNRNANIKDGNGKSVACPVYIVQLEKDHQWIYQLHHLDRTKTLLQKHDEIAEPDYLHIIDTYYQQMADHLSQDSIDIWQDGIMSLNFEKVSQFQLISDVQNVVDVFIELDEESEKLADAYEMIRMGGSALDPLFIKKVTGEHIQLDEDRKIPSFQRKALTRLLLSRLSEYMVQIRHQRFQKTKPLHFMDRNEVESTFYWVPQNQLKDFYDMEVGYGEVEEARMW